MTDGNGPLPVTKAVKTTAILQIENVNVIMPIFDSKDNHFKRRMNH